MGVCGGIIGEKHKSMNKYLKKYDYCIIHYGKNNHKPDPKWREVKGRIYAIGRGPGPKNVLVITCLGSVVVPMGNIKEC